MSYFPTDRKFSVIVADPPWKFKISSPKGGAKSPGRHYPTMSFQEISEIPVADLAADDCALFLWATGPLLPRSLEVMKAWGFTYKTDAFVWVKMNKNALTPATGLGFWTRKNAEYVIMGTRGHPKRISKGVHQILMEDEVYLAARGRHSEKPEGIQDRIEELLEGPYAELFARRRRPGWWCWGNEIEPGEDPLEEATGADLLGDLA